MLSLLPLVMLLMLTTLLASDAVTASEYKYSSSMKRPREVRWWVAANRIEENVSFLDSHAQAATGVYTYLGIGVMPSGELSVSHSAQELHNLTAPYLVRGYTVMPAIGFDVRAVLGGVDMRKAADIAATLANSLGWDGLMIDYEPTQNYTAAHVNAYAAAAKVFADAMHSRGMRLGMCISSWGINDAHEVPQGLRVYADTGADILMSMAPTYYAKGDLSKAKNFVETTLAQGVSHSQLAVGIGSVLTPNCPTGQAKWDYNWTSASLSEFVGFLDQPAHTPAAIDVWRADIDSEGNCTESYYFDILAHWLRGASSRSSYVG